jgi:hypothetical protein
MKGAASDSADMTMAPMSSIVATMGLPRPAVSAPDCARARTVELWVSAAAPPPAMIANAHFSKGGRSVITAAETPIPATTAAGVAMESSRWSSPGT